MSAAATRLDGGNQITRTCMGEEKRVIRLVRVEQLSRHAGGSPDPQRRRVMRGLVTPGPKLDDNWATAVEDTGEDP